MQKDNVNHPSHYTWLKDKCGIEVIDITRHLDFNTGNAIKYLLRAGHKEDASLTSRQKEIEDYEKAVWYINDKIQMLKRDKRELNDAVETVPSSKHKEHLKAEYFHLKMRLNEVEGMLNKWDRGELDFTPACSRAIYDVLVINMKYYLNSLETIALTEKLI